MPPPPLFSPAVGPLVTRRPTHITLSTMGLAVGVVTHIGQVLRRWGYEYGHYGWCGEADVGASVAGRGRGPRPVDQVRRPHRKRLQARQQRQRMWPHGWWQGDRTNDHGPSGWPCSRTPDRTRGSASTCRLNQAGRQHHSGFRVSTTGVVVPVADGRFHNMQICRLQLPTWRLSRRPVRSRHAEPC